MYTITNLKKRPIAKDRNSKYKKYLKNYLTKLKEDSNLLTNIRKKFPIDTKYKKFLGSDIASILSTSLNAKLVINIAGNNNYEGSIRYTILVYIVYYIERIPIDTTNI